MAEPPLPDGRVDGNPKGLSFWALVREDFVTHERDWLRQGFWALFWHRFGNWRMSVRPKPLRAPLSILYKIMFKATQWFCGIELPYTTPIGRRVRIDHFGGIVVSARRIGDDVVLRQNVTIGLARLDDLNAKPSIGHRVDIGAGAAILGPVRIGDGAAVGANAVVLEDVPAGALAVGVPARTILRTPKAKIAGGEGASPAS